MSIHPELKRFLFPVVLLSLLAFACEDREVFAPSPPPVKPHPPVQTLTELKLQFPLAAGNRWIYVDTFYTRIDTTVAYDTVIVSGSHADADGNWWDLSSGSSWKEYSSLLSRNDSVFGEAGFVQPVAVRRYERVASTAAGFHPRAAASGAGPALEYLAIPLSDTVRFPSMGGTKCVTFVGGMVISPAGTFDDCGVFFYPDPDGAGTLYEEVVKPGVGIVACRGVIGWSDVGGEVRVSAWLRSYSVNP